VVKAVTVAPLGLPVDNVVNDQTPVQRPMSIPDRVRELTVEHRTWATRMRYRTTMPCSVPMRRGPGQAADAVRQLSAAAVRPAVSPPTPSRCCPPTVNGPLAR
jgi:hypothetical protein